ncbi:SDR family NAD(P)-dependent oxidoreductase [Auritidibacter ignavus]|uniref:SDR family NAD(P)-dependent oxidoreductase n=1 Tax=Auritidibacter ignavus TaxID=678932 RepID=UPI00109C68FE|nr:SDR family oxidoreductase [Auritidibacter ignavus]
MDIAIVTGATGGIGRAICKRLCKDGFGVLALYGSNHQAADDLQQDLTRNGGTCTVQSTDLKSEAGIETACHFVDDYLEREPAHEIHALVNNAAKLLSPSFFETQIRHFDDYFSINTKAPFFLAQHVSKRMKTGGSIVNISSASAHFSSPGDITYAMSKDAIESFTRNAAEAIAPMGIRINAIVPGFTDNGHPAFANPGVLEYMSSFAVMGGIATAETVAAAVSFLVSDESSRTTGSLIDVTGGGLLGARGHRVGSVQDLF